MTSPNPANETGRLSMAELRRRLHAAPSSAQTAAVEETENPPPTTANPGPNRRPLTTRPTHSASVASEPDMLLETPTPPQATPVSRQTPPPGANLRPEFIRREAVPETHYGDLLFPEMYVEGDAVPVIPVARPVPVQRAAIPANIVEELLNLRKENQELRKLLEEMKAILEDAQDQEKVFQEREKILQNELTEKTQHLQELEEQLVQIEEQIANTPKPKNAEELAEWEDELEKEAARVTQDRKRLDAERHQFREDEEAMEEQMRTMEVQMARERAMMARQETELKRLSADITHELELMQRGDATLREQMQKFQRRHQEVLARGAGLPVQPTPPQPQPQQPVPPPQQQQPQQLPPGAKDSGLLRRLFRPGSGNK